MHATAHLLPQPNTQISLATTREATGGSSQKLNIFLENEEYDEIELLRKRKEDKLRREAESLQALKLKIQEIAPRVMPPAEPDALIFEMHWGFPPRPRTTK
jgi:hypothetical protein